MRPLILRCIAINWPNSSATSSAGLIPADEADAARNEVSRRILAAQAELASEQKPGQPVPAWVSVATVIAVPAIALGAYLQIGRPDLPAQPLQARIDSAVANQDMVAMVRQVERHLEQKPNDARGWMVLAPAYKRMARYQRRRQCLQEGDCHIRA